MSLLMLPALCLLLSGDADTLKQLADDYYQHQIKLAPMLEGKPLTEAPDTTFAFAKAQADDAKKRLEALDALNLDKLTHNDRLTVEMMRFQLQSTIDLLDGHYLEFDLLPYSLGFIMGELPKPALAWEFDPEEGRDPYIAYVTSVAGFWKDQLQKLKLQEIRGIIYPKQTLPGVRGLLAAALESAKTFKPNPERMSHFTESQREADLMEINKKVDEELIAAIEDLTNYIGEDYEKKAGDTVGLSQYRGGKDYYRTLVRVQTNMDLDPDAIHQMGLDHVAEIQKQMAAIRKQVGFKGSQEKFHAKLKKDKRFVPKKPEDIEERFNVYIKRIEPKIDTYFSMKPEAPYGVKRLDPAQEAGMTFGYYSRPGPGQETGLYYFNGSDLPNRSMLWAAPLIYHELIPGHHFHIALQSENEDLHPYRRIQYNTIFTEGWGNYAAWLAGEMGMYADDPYDQYGWLVFDLFISVRLVLDTGLNAKGWTLEQARAYMKENTFQSETEVNSETLRYSTDMPGQALGYKLGMERFKELRKKAVEARGRKFNEKRFHAAALGAGTITMPLLEMRVDHYIKTGKSPK